MFFLYLVSTLLFGIKSVGIFVIIMISVAFSYITLRYVSYLNGEMNIFHETLFVSIVVEKLNNHADIYIRTSERSTVKHRALKCVILCLWL